MGQRFARGDQVGLLLAAANRDPGQWDRPDQFRPDRPPMPLVTFGAGLHFCVGAPLARLELQLALPILFARCPGLRLAEPPRYADVYHFHGLQRLMVTAGEAIARLPPQGFFVCPLRRAFGWRCGMRGAAPQTPRSIWQRAIPAGATDASHTSAIREPYVIQTPVPGQSGRVVVDLISSMLRRAVTL